MCESVAKSFAGKEIKISQSFAVKIGYCSSKKHWRYNRNLRHQLRYFALRLSIFGSKIDYRSPLKNNLYVGSMSRGWDVKSILVRKLTKKRWSIRWAVARCKMSIARTSAPRTMYKRFWEVLCLYLVQTLNLWITQYLRGDRHLNLTRYRAAVHFSYIAVSFHLKVRIGLRPYQTQGSSRFSYIAFTQSVVRYHIGLLFTITSYSTKPQMFNVVVA